MPGLPISPGGPSGPSLLCKLTKKKTASGQQELTTLLNSNKERILIVTAYLQANQHEVTGRSWFATGRVETHMVSFYVRNEMKLTGNELGMHQVLEEAPNRTSVKLVIYSQIQTSRINNS